MDEFERGLESASQKFESFSSGIKNVGEKISSAGGTLTKGITLPLAGLGTAALKTGMDYEAGMSKVQAISGATADEMVELGDKAMEMAAKTKFSTSDSAEAYQYMAMAGWKAGDMVDGLTGIMNLAAASGENLGTTSDIVTDALTAFGLKASDSGRFADVLAAASNNANTNVSMLGESFKYVAPVAGALGYSVEDTSIALGLMANSGIKASQAGTSLRTAMTNMTSPTSEMQKVMEMYGITLTDANGGMLSLADVMAQLRNKMGGLDESTQASAASTLFGKEAMSGMLAIINAAPEDFSKLTEAINNSNGTTEKMASIMQDNAAGAFERLKSAVNVLFTQLSEHLLPIFTSIVEKLTAVVNWFGQLDSGTQKLILTIAGVAAAIGPVLLGIGKVMTAVSTIGTAVKGFISVIKVVGGAVSALFSLLAANPIVLVIAGIAALVAAFVVLWNKCEGFRNFWIDLWGKIKEVAAAAWDGIKKVFDAVVPYFKQAFSIAWDSVKLVWNAATGYFKQIWETIKGIFSVVKDVLSGDFKGAWEGIKAIFSGWGSYFQGLWDQVKKIFSMVDQFFGGIFSRAWQSVKNAWSNVKSFFSGIVDKIKNVFSSLPSALLNIGRNMMEGLWNGIKSKLDWVKQKAQSAVDGIKGLFTGKKGFDTHSPSRWSRQLFENVMKGGEEGLEAGLPALLQDAESITGRIKNSMDFSVSPNLQANMSAGFTASAAQPAAAAASYGGTTINITVNGAQYSDERALAQFIAQEIQAIANRRDAFAPA